MKQKKLNFKPDRKKRERYQKRKANDSGGRDWKSKLCKAIKIDQGLKSIMLTMATEEQTNQALVSALAASNSKTSVPGNQALSSELSACSIQPSSTTLVVRPSTPNAVTTAGVAINQLSQDTISTVVQAYLTNDVKLQSIIKK